MSKADNKINREMLTLEEDQAPSIEASLTKSKAKKLMIVSSSKTYIPDLNKEPYSDSEGEDEEKTLVLFGLKVQDTNDCAPKLLIGGSSRPYIPDLNEKPCSDSEGEDEEKGLIITGLKDQDANNCPSKLLYELQVEVFARVSCLEYWKLRFVNRKFSKLVKSSEIFRVRQEQGLMKPYVFMLSSDRFTMFDQDFKNFQMLPAIPSDDYCFIMSDKETICAGTQLMVFGKEIKSNVVWRFELEMCKWVKGPAMITPRSLFGSASRGKNAFFAGGVKMSENMVFEVVNLAEKYNADTKTWTSIHGMHKRRKFSAGCFFHGKFYVIGGRNENNEYLTCGESYNEVTDSWELIPDMIKDMSTPLSPPLIAVVNNNLYMLDTTSNELNVYDINKNVWKKLGVVPVRADSFRGYGVAFKSIGDRLLLVGGLNVGGMCKTMSVFSCYPSTNMKEIIWEKFDDCCRPETLFHHFIYNCSVMFA